MTRLADEERVMRKRTNFDIYLEEQFKDKEFADRFKQAEEAWNVALKLASLRIRKEPKLSQKEVI
jgi:hypothetical protein